jgi:hypothetical protein
MATKKELLGNELMKELVRIRIDTLWNMIALKLNGRLPPVDAEKATGDLDDKGALFVPGGFVFNDWEENPIRKRPYAPTADGFRKTIRNAMRADGAHLLYQDGIAARVKLGNTAFAKIASHILESKQEALRRRRALGDRPPARISSADITRSYCPTWIPSPYGARTSISSDISVCLTEPRMFYRQSEIYFNLRGGEADRFWAGVKASTRPISSRDGVLLAQPFMVTCHNTRYREEIFTGITRISGYGKFGEFATFTLEQTTSELLHDLEAGRTQFTQDEIIANYYGCQVAAVLRTYPRTNPGARLKKGVTTVLVSPEKDLDLDLEAINAEAKKRYHLR